MSGLDIALIVAASVAGLLGYIAAAGYLHRRWDGTQRGDLLTVIPYLWPLFFVVPLLWQPFVWAWKLGAEPREPKPAIPTATARERK